MYKVIDIEKDFKTITEIYLTKIRKSKRGQLSTDLIESYGVIFHLKTYVNEMVESLDIDYSKYDDYSHYTEELEIDSCFSEMPISYDVEKTFRLIEIINEVKKNNVIDFVVAEGVLKLSNEVQNELSN